MSIYGPSFIPIGSDLRPVEHRRTDIAFLKFLNEENK